MLDFLGRDYYVGDYTIDTSDGVVTIYNVVGFEGNKVQLIEVDSVTLKEHGNVKECHVHDVITFSENQFISVSDRVNILKKILSTV